MKPRQTREALILFPLVFKKSCNQNEARKPETYFLYYTRILHTLFEMAVFFFLNHTSCIVGS